MSEEKPVLIRTVMCSTECTARCCSNARITTLTPTWGIRVHVHVFAFLLSFVNRGHQLTDSSYKDYNCMSTRQMQKPRKWGTLGYTDSVNHRKTYTTRYAMFYMQNLPQMYNFCVLHQETAFKFFTPIFTPYSVSQNSWPVLVGQFWP